MLAHILTGKRAVKVHCPHPLRKLPVASEHVNNIFRAVLLTSQFSIAVEQVTAVEQYAHIFCAYAAEQPLGECGVGKREAGPPLVFNRTVYGGSPPAVSFISSTAASMTSCELCSKRYV